MIPSPGEAVELSYITDRNENGIATLENNLLILCKVKHTHTI